MEKWENIMFLICGLFSIMVSIGTTGIVWSNWNYPAGYTHLAVILLTIPCALLFLSTIFFTLHFVFELIPIHSPTLKGRVSLGES